jgi:hypothetical protein
MPIPKPNAGESQEAYLARGMADPVLMREYPTPAQRSAVLYGNFRQKASRDAGMTDAMPVRMPFPRIPRDRFGRRKKLHGDEMVAPHDGLSTVDSDEV